jgi:ABC-2 type transport system permease protein
MSSKAITPHPQDRHEAGWQETPTGAPSFLRRDDPGFARTIGALGGVAVVFGAFALLLFRTTNRAYLGTGGATFFVALGLCGLLFHAAFDWDLAFRRLYMLFGYLLLVVGAFLTVLPWPTRVGDLFGLGFSLMTLGLFFILAFLRNEDEPWYRNLAHYVLGVAGAAMALTGLVGGCVSVDFLVPFGTLLSILGLVYLSCFIASRGTSDDRAYWVAQAMGVAGIVVFLIAFLRSIIPVFAGRRAEYLVPAGMLLMILGVFYIAAALFLTSERPMVVLTRREIASYFYSPIVYIVLLACVIAHGLSYFMYMLQLLDPNEPHLEPIVRGFVLQWPPVIFTLCVVPLLTMRLLSEERRTGTLEVLLTAPVTEGAVAVSKFLAAFVMFLLTWVPMALDVAYLRVDTGQPFDYRPLLSFLVALCVTGAGFVSMGVFFSSLTRNQIASGALTLVGMVTLTLVFLAQFAVQRYLPDSGWSAFLSHISYIDIWINTLDGKLQPTYLIFFGSLTVLWLFLTVKVLEARKWAA